MKSIAEVITEATREWGNRHDGPDLMSTVARHQREADALLVELQIKSLQGVLQGIDKSLVFEDIKRLSAEQDEMVKGAIENFLRSIAEQIRSQPIRIEWKQGYEDAFAEFVESFAGGNET